MSDSHPKTIVHIITSLGVGGAERVLSNLVLGMDRKKFHNIVISLRDLGHWGPILEQNNIPVYVLNMQPNISSIFKHIKLWRILRQLKPDYVQGWMYHANVVALITGRLAGVKNIYWNIRCSLMDLSKYKLHTTLTFKLGALLSRFPAAIINNSKVSIQQHLAKGYNNTNWVYIPNGFDLAHFQPDAEIYSDFRAQHKIPAAATIIAMVARFDPMKDHATFLRAAGILAAKQQNVYFVCIGRNVNWSNTELTQIIAEYSLADRVLLLDQMNNLHNVYPAFDYLTQTSLFGEGFPNVVAEAMACGVPCFVTDVGDALDVVGEMGYQIEKQDHAQLADQWLQVLTVKSKDNAAVRARIGARFSLQNIIARYSEQYGKIAT